MRLPSDSWRILHRWKGSWWDWMLIFSILLGFLELWYQLLLIFSSCFSSCFLFWMFPFLNQFVSSLLFIFLIFNHLLRTLPLQGNLISTCKYSTTSLINHMFSYKISLRSSRWSYLRQLLRINNTSTCHNP